MVTLGVDQGCAGTHSGLDCGHALCALRKIFAADGKFGFPEARKSADDRRVQGARRAEQNSAALGRRAPPRRDRGFGGKSRAGSGVSRDQARHQSANLHAADHAAGESIRNARLRRGSDPGRRELRRSLRRSAAPLQGIRPDVHSSVRRRSRDRRPGNARNRNARAAWRPRRAGHSRGRRRIDRRRGLRGERNQSQNSNDRCAIVQARLDEGGDRKK